MMDLSSYGYCEIEEENSHNTIPCLLYTSRCV